MRKTIRLLCLLALLALPRTLPAAPLVKLTGADLKGGAAGIFGANHYGRQPVNYIYARPHGAAAGMNADFRLPRLPQGPLYLYVEGLEDDFPGRCRIRIRLNGQTLLDGPSGFPDGAWLVRAFPIPPGALRAGENTLVITNEEPEGALGMPPWFMVARAAVAGRNFRMPEAGPLLRVRLPGRLRPLPEPLPEGRSEPGFRFRGTKGWNWTPAQYLAEIPTLTRLKMNFMMNCYASLFTQEPGRGWVNEWYKPMPDSLKAGFREVIRECRKAGITFCFAVHPQLASPRPLDPARAEDLDAFRRHFDWAQGEGVKWFSVSLDDVSWGDAGPASGGLAHARLVNAILDRLRARDPEARLIFCPVPYWGDGTNPEHRAYLEALAREMRRDVYVFWTGDGVVGGRITRRAAESYRKIAGHRLFLWDNYPVNDASAAMHLGPVSGRDPDLCEVIDGYMSNPLSPQNEMNRLPLSTCADYAYNPRAYDPARSIGQAILHLAATGPQRRVLKELTEAYPGFLVTGGGTGANPVRVRFRGLPTRREAEACLRRIESLAARLKSLFPDRFADGQRTLEAEIEWMKGHLPEK